MSWPLRALIGPSLWALGFTLTYALHGIGCARGWPALAAPLGNLHAFSLILAFLATVLAALLALLLVPRGQPGIERLVVGSGGWIGLVASVLTLFPVLGLTSCG